MARVLNPKWKDQMLEKIASGQVDEILAQSLPAQWLIMRLTERGIQFRVYNVGAGVRRITTDTDTCPCCKRKL